MKSCEENNTGLPLSTVNSIPRHRYIIQLFDKLTKNTKNETSFAFNDKSESEKIKYGLTMMHHYKPTTSRYIPMP